jgi:hypothetical protein
MCLLDLDVHGWFGQRERDGRNAKENDGNKEIEESYTERQTDTGDGERVVKLVFFDYGDNFSSAGPNFDFQKMYLGKKDRSVCGINLR